MTVTIYHNPRCSKSREVLRLICEAGITPKVVEYLKTPLTHKELEDLYKKLGEPTPISMIRTKEFEFKASNLSTKSSKDDIFRAIAANPVLLERPIVITPKGARICRPPDVVSEIL